MKRLPIHFFSEDIVYRLNQKEKLRNWINNTIVAEGFKLKELNFIFCSDVYLLNMNNQFLKHDTYTDIITFDNSDEEKEIMGDIFISIDRIRENANSFNAAEADELHRVMIHGTLHLLGYPDKGETAKAVMTQKENDYLAKRNF